MLVVALALTGCAADGERATGIIQVSGDSDSIAFDHTPEWPDSVVARQVGHAFHTVIVKVDVDPEGRAWLLREELGMTVDRRRPILERYRADGALEQRMTFAPGARVPDFVLHPSGEVTVFVLRPDPGASMQTCDLGVCPLTLVRLSAAGKVLAQRDPLETPLSSQDHVVAAADGEGLYLVAWTDGARLFRLGADYDERWTAMFMPRNIGMAYVIPNELIRFDEQGNVYVGYRIFKDDVATYNAHVQRPPLVPIGIYDTLVQGFTPEGAFLGARLLGGPGVSEPRGMTVHDGRVTVTGAIRLTKYDPGASPNRTMEWDLFVARGRLDDPTTTDAYQAIDLARDDFAAQIVEGTDGTLYFAGRTDYVQVDTNSEVEDGKGLFLALAPELRQRGAVTLTGPRDVQIQACKLLPDGRLLFAGTRNGPLTHTADPMKYNEAVLGIVRLSDAIQRTAGAASR